MLLNLPSSGKFKKLQRNLSALRSSCSKQAFKKIYKILSMLLKLLYSYFKEIHSLSNDLFLEFILILLFWDRWDLGKTRISQYILQSLQRLLDEACVKYPSTRRNHYIFSSLSSQEVRS